MGRADAARRVAAAALLLGVSACGPSGESRGRRNLVLITLDTTRADRLGCYGSKTVKTPNIDRIAAGGTVFDRAFTPAPITGPAHASILSGTFPPFHQVRDNDVYRVPRGLPWLPSLLKARGFRTAAMVSGYPVRAGIGFARGFDYFGDHLEAPIGSLMVTNVHSVGVADRRGDRVSEEFRLWLEKNGRTEPFFVWLHYFDPHYPYDPPAGYADVNPAQPYDGEIAFMDDCVGKALDALAAKGLSGRTGVVVVADHGEGLMDHGELTHAMLLYNSTLRVPLVVRLPWMKAQQPRVAAFVSGADVMPTILDALGVAPGRAPVQARSLLPLLSPGADPSAGGWAGRPLYFETFYPLHHYRWSPLRGFISGGRKYVHGPVDELYDLNADMGETRNLVAGEDAAAMVRRFPSLQAELRKGRPSAARHEPTREEIASLRSLGYLAGGAGVDEEEALAGAGKLPHPAVKMEEFFRVNDIVGLSLGNKVGEALEEARAMADADRTNKDARIMVATFSSRLGMREAADRHFSELVRDFSDKDILFTAGSYFLMRKDLEKARGCFERLTGEDAEDVESTTRLADVAAAQGDPAARALYEKALGIDPAYRQALHGLAVLLDRKGSPEAEERFATAAAKYPFDPLVSYDYGIYLLRHRRATEATVRLRQAAALSDGPLYAAAQFALASFYRESGEPDRARACLREVELRTADPTALTRARAMLAEMEGE